MAKWTATVRALPAASLAVTAWSDDK